MIDTRVFGAWWARLEERFGKQPGADAYARYLNAQGMGSQEFEGAASALWATSRFFPRPAEFLFIEAGIAWKCVQDNAPRMVPPVKSREDYDEARGLIPPRAWEALQSLGGPRVVADSHDLVRLRRDFLDAYELVVVEASRGALTLEPAKPVALLKN